MTTDLCPHFGICGGCASQDRPYPDQLAEKEARVRSLLAPLGPEEVRPIIASPDIFHYRNKMEFAFGGPKDGPVLLGLRRRKRFSDIVDLTECRLLSPEAGRLLAAVREWAAREKVPTYHLRAHRGFLRYLVVREGKNTGQRLIALVTAEGTLPSSFADAVKASGVRVDTALWLVNAGLSDVARGEARAVLWGPGHIEERLGRLTYRISPATFFQTNTRGAERLYDVVKELLEAGPLRTLFDLYCGCGSIGLHCADRAEVVVGIELDGAAVEDARRNAREAGVLHAQFHAMNAAVFGASPAAAGWGDPGTAAVCDPPRPGLAPELLRLLRDRPIARWVYVSCNPESLARDLAALAGVYRVRVVQPVDLFPHTPHVETVALLERRDSPPRHV